MPIRITELLRQVGPETERVVSETRQRFNQAVRRHLRDETRLHLTASGERGDERDVRAVRVSVTTGMPEELEDQQFDDGLALALALAPLTRVLEESHLSLSSLIPSVARLYDRDDFGADFADAGPALEEARETIAELLKEASRANVLGQIFAIRSDVMGVYRFDPPAQPSWDDTDDANARIELFWGVIGLVSRLLGVSVEGLTVKVLAHELAHAYTHVGADADGRRWGTGSFQRTDRALLEGLAQYYTCRVLERLGKQAPGAMDAYEKLLPHQPDIYRSHLGWLERHTPEDVRHAMLTIRCRAAGSFAEFEALLGEARARRRSER
jgi:hypothetical protein